MLSHIRKPYLNVDTRPHASRQSTRTLDLGSSDESWSSIRWLTNEERDQIDLQARVILTKCADRVKEMEALETRTKSFLYADQRNLKNRRLQVFCSVVRQSGACHQ
jgi:syntaxin 18